MKALIQSPICPLKSRPHDQSELAGEALLGMTVEEALMETDRFIDNGVLSGQTTLYLIHGKGTGALRKAIHEHLRRHPSVKSFRLGNYGEGEAGVTVVELK